MVRLSERLSCISRLVPAGSALADIGSDHALLPVYLAQQRVIRRAVAGELNEGPYRAALKQVQEAAVQEIVEVRKGNGLEVISCGEADVVAIAGMGGGLIVSILTDGFGKLGGIRKLILQPNIGEELVRRWLFDNGWLLTEEYILEDEGKIYEILTAIPEADAPGRNTALYEGRMLEQETAVSKEILLRMGPYLLEEGSPAFIRKWLDELVKMERICKQLAHSTTRESLVKQAEMATEIAQIKEVLQCLQKRKR